MSVSTPEKTFLLGPGILSEADSWNPSAQVLRSACARSLEPAMEPWPGLAWVLLLTIIMGFVRSSHTRDFTEQDIVFLHPASSPFPGGFKCFTCEDAQDNFECNRWAPDMYCPREATYCYTRHTIDGEGNSASVTKRCVVLEDCLSTGCTELDYEGKQVCTACCEGNICNLPVPWNQTDSIFSLTALSGTVGLSQSPSLTFPLVSTFLFLSSGV